MSRQAIYGGLHVSRPVRDARGGGGPAENGIGVWFRHPPQGALPAAVCLTEWSAWAVGQARTRLVGAAEGVVLRWDIENGNERLSIPGNSQVRHH
jgi:hypothetical protein